MNKTIISGNVGAEDAELKELPSGTPVLNFSFANNESYRDKESQKHTTTTWYNAEIFGKRAESLEKYVTRGKPLLLTGRVKAKSWKTDKDEIKTDLILTVDEIEFFGGSNKGEVQEAVESLAGAVEDDEFFPN